MHLIAQTPRSAGGSGSPNEFNRSILTQKTLFGYHNTLNTTGGGSAVHNYSGAGNQSQQPLNVSISGPPAQGLFDALSSEKNRIGDSSHFASLNQSQHHTINRIPAGLALNIQNQSINQSYQYNDSINDSYLNESR